MEPEPLFISTWEYHIEYLYSPLYDVINSRLFNSLGRDGWELVNVINLDEANRAAFCAIFKRKTDILNVFEETKQ